MEFQKLWNHYKPDIHIVRHVGIDDLNYIYHG